MAVVEVLLRAQKTNPRLFSHFGVELLTEEVAIRKSLRYAKFQNSAFLQFAQSFSLSRGDPARTDAFCRLIVRRAEWRFIFEEILNDLKAHSPETVEALDVEEMIQVGLFWAHALEVAEEVAVRHPLLGSVIARLRLSEEDYGSGGVFDLLLESILQGIKDSKGSCLDARRVKGYQDLRRRFKGLFE